MPVAQVDDAGKSALDYAQEAGHRSTWLLLWQAHQENATKEPWGSMSSFLKVVRLT